VAELICELKKRMLDKQKRRLNRNATDSVPFTRVASQLDWLLGLLVVERVSLRHFSGLAVAIAVRFIFLTSLVLVFALLALLELLCLLFLAVVHLIHLLLLAALELVLALLVCILPAQPLLLLVLAPLHVLAFGILLPLHLVELLLVPLLQPWIGGRVVGMARRGRTIESAAVIVVAIAWAV